jgi:hypothetical protein
MRALASSTTAASRVTHLETSTVEGERQGATIGLGPASSSSRSGRSAGVMAGTLGVAVMAVLLGAGASPLSASPPPESQAAAQTQQIVKTDRSAATQTSSPKQQIAPPPANNPKGQATAPPDTTSTPPDTTSTPPDTTTPAPVPPPDMTPPAPVTPPPVVAPPVVAPPVVAPPVVAPPVVAPPPTSPPAPVSTTAPQPPPAPMSADEKQLRDAVSSLVDKKFGGDLKAGFDHYDKNQDGALDKGELKSMLSDAGIGNIFTRGTWASRIIQKIDGAASANHDGKIQWTEFEVLLPPDGVN